MARATGFFHGLTAGAVGSLLAGLVVLYVLAARGLVQFEIFDPPAIGRILNWTYANLGLSIPVFMLVLFLYLRDLHRLRRHVADKRPPDAVSHQEYLVDVWTSLFFGIGVIWTAIGMRGALIFALGDPQSTLDAGAFALLQRMVDGGILVALSTTIFGGVGGYLMRVIKTTVTGAELRAYYDELARAHSGDILNTLHRIEAHLDSLATRSSPPDNNDVQTTVGSSYLHRSA